MHFDRHAAGLVTALAALACASTSALAQDPEPEPRTDLADAAFILVTATRRATADSAVPAATSRVGRTGAEGLDTRLFRTVTDALADLPSVMVQKTSYGQASPFIRGFTGYQTVMLVDGIRLNNSTFRSGPNQYWSTIDPFVVDHIEVVRGPGSVLYGSDAVGGVVNAVARRREAFEPGLHLAGRTVVRRSDAEDSWTGRGEIQGNQDDLGFLVGATYGSYGDLTAGHGTGLQPGTGYRDTASDLRLDWHQDDRTTWAFGVQHVDQDGVPRTHKTVDARSWRGTTVGSELRRDLYQTRDLVYARVDRALDARFADRAEITASWHEQDEEQVRRRDIPRTDIQGVDVRTLGLQAQFDKGTGWGDVTYGVEWWRDDVTSFRRDYVNGALSQTHVQGPVADDARYDLVGVYVQDAFLLGDTTVTAGARWTYAKARAGRVDNPTVGGADPGTPGNVIRLSDSWSDVVSSLRAVHPLATDWNAFGGVSQAFRAPNLSDLTRLDDTSGVETPSPGLDSEDYLTYEAGVRGRGERWRVQAAYWYTDIRGMIVPSPTGRNVGGTPEVRKDNVGDGWVNGVELEGRYALSDELTLDAAYSWMYGRVDQIDPARGVVREPLSRLMPRTVAATLTWRPTGSAFDWWIAGRAAERQDHLSLKDATDTDRIPAGGTPGYAVVSLGTTFHISETADLSIVLDNVADRDYRIHGSGVNEPGRNLVLALDLRW